MDREQFPGRSPGQPSSVEPRDVAAPGTPGKRTRSEALVAPHHEAAATAGAGAGAGAVAEPPAPRGPEAATGGKPTLQMLFGVPRTTTVAGGDPARIHAAAARGSATPASKLPYGDPIQRAFGRHDISGIQAHVGDAAADSAREIGARAYAVGDHVVLGAAPDLHTTAHEAAHVIQQRAGVQLKGGVGEVGDAYERHADEAADLVVAGRSAEAVLDRFAPGARGAAPHAVQRAVDTHYGTFDTEKFEEVQADEHNAPRVEMFLRFTPNQQVDATEIALSQSVKTQIDGQSIPIDATKRRQQAPTGPGAGYVIDGKSEARNPLYLEADQYTEVGLHAQATDAPSGGFAQQGYRKRESGVWKTQDAQIHDEPTLNTAQPGASTLFETTAIAVKGNQQNTYYGSVTWGMKTDDEGKLTKVDLAKGSDAVPTQKFMAAARQWNQSRARGTLVTRSEPTQVLDESLEVKFTLSQAVKLEQQDTAMVDGTTYLAVAVAADAAAHAGERGYVKLDDVEDLGDGKATIPLPHIRVKRTTMQAALYPSSDMQGQPIQLPQGTRLKLLQDGAAQQVEVVDGPDTGKTGWIAGGKIEDED